MAKSSNRFSWYSCTKIFLALGHSGDFVIDKNPNRIN